MFKKSRSVLRGCLLRVGLAFGLLAGPAVFADEVAFVERVREVPYDFVGSLENMFTTRTSLRDFLVGGSLTAISAAFDDEVREYALEEEPFESVEELGNDVLGDTVWLAGTAVGLSLGGLVLDHGTTFDAGAAACEALLINLGFVELLKSAVGRERPDESGDKSFPSGHVAGITTLTVVLGEMYDMPRPVKWGLYVFPIITAAARIQSDDHFLSDTIAGMTLGTLVAHAVADEWREKDAAKEGGLGMLLAPDLTGLQYVLVY